MKPFLIQCLCDRQSRIVNLFLQRILDGNGNLNFRRTERWVFLLGGNVWEVKSEFFMFCIGFASIFHSDLNVWNVNKVEFLIWNNFKTRDFYKSLSWAARFAKFNKFLFLKKNMNVWSFFGMFIKIGSLFSSIVENSDFHPRKI